MANTHLRSSSTSKNQRRQLIVGGQVAQPGKYPYFALVNDDCGGSLIAPDIVLTAGHCKPHRTLRNSYEDEEVDYVRVGIFAREEHNSDDDDEDDDHNTDDDGDDDDFDEEEGGDEDNHVSSSSLLQVGGGEETFAVLDATRHSRFQRLGDDEFRFDYTIILLNGTSTHPTLSINRNPDIWDRYTSSGSSATVTAMGMGDTNKHHASKSSRLREVNLTVVPNEVCEQTTSFDKHGYEIESYQGRIGRSHLCTFAPHKDSCAYDSGSPILLTDSITNNVNSKHLLVGMVSWGMECADKVFPAVNSRVSVASDWIDSVVCDWSENPPKEFHCNGYDDDDTGTITVPVLTPSGGTVVTATNAWTTMRSNADFAFILIMCFMASVGSRLWWGRRRRFYDYEELK